MKRVMTSVLAIIIACMTGVAFSSSAQQRDEVVLTLDRAVEFALKSNESLMNTKLDEELARISTKELYADLLPKLDFRSDFTRNWALPEFTFGGQTFKAGTDNVINFGLDLTQNIYSGGVFSSLKIVRYNQQISETNTEWMREDIALRVYEKYYDVLLAETVLDLSTAAYDRAVVQYETAQLYHEAGTVSEYDVLRAKVEVANAHAPVTQAKNGLTVAQANLKQLIGLPQAALIRCTGSLDVDISNLTAEVETATGQALANRTDLKAAQLLIEMNDLAVRVARRRNHPDISLSAGYLMQAQVGDPNFSSLAFSDFSRSWNTRLNVSFPVFDGRLNSALVNRAQAAFERSRYTESEIRKQIEVDVTETVLDLTEASERVAAGAETVELASRGLSIAQVQYESGISNQLELIDAQYTLKRAETDHARAKYDFATAAARLQHVLGLMDIPADD